MATTDDEREPALLSIGAGTSEILRGTHGDVLLGCQVGWDSSMSMWRADWDGGVAFGDSKHEAVINAFQIRLGLVEPE